MTSRQIKDKILNYEYTEELLVNELEYNFKETIEGVFNALYELLTKYDKNKDTIKELLFFLKVVALNEKDINNIVLFRNNVKRINGSIFKNLKPFDNRHYMPIIKELKELNNELYERVIKEDELRKLAIIEKVIFEKRDLNVITALIRDNKKILKIRDNNNENILYKLLKRYSYLKEEEQDEINYFYQVILLFINNEELSIDITRNKDYYLSILKTKSSKHVIGIRREIEFKNLPSDKLLANRFNVYVKSPSITERERLEIEVRKANYLDYTDKCFVTIDGEESKCLDDALYIEKNKDGTYYLYVNITSLSSLFRFNSRIIQEAIEREETIYLCDKAISLYPEYVSDYLVSLLPNQVRYTQMGRWLLTPDMTIVEGSFELFNSVIKSHHRLTYDGADRIIADKTNDELRSVLTNLAIFALKQKENNKAKDEYRKKENANNPKSIHESLLTDLSASANIVQECMLLFGKSKGELAKIKDIPYIFRGCDQFVSMKLKELTIETLDTQASPLAYYTNKPTKHHGLNYEVYTHSSAPGRRASDTVNQFIDDALILNSNPTDEEVRFWIDETERFSKHFNKTKQRVDAFSRQYNYIHFKRRIKQR